MPDRQANSDSVCAEGRLLSWSIALLLVCLCCCGLTGPLHAHESQDEDGARAVRVGPTAPMIDGRFDDDVWRTAPIATGFTQQDPSEGESATEETAFQVAYDDEALYIAILCYDSDPQEVVRRLYRRDQIQHGETDWVGVLLDPHHDHQTGFEFAVTPSGSYADDAIANDSDVDGTWNSVWQVETAIHERGWSVELKIPYHALRFSPKEEYTWGINVYRRVNRKQEFSMWVLTRRDEAGISSRNGHLEGIRGIHPPAHIEVLPYTVARQTARRQLLFPFSDN